MKLKHIIAFIALSIFSFSINNIDTFAANTPAGAVKITDWDFYDSGYGLPIRRTNPMTHWLMNDFYFSYKVTNANKTTIKADDQTYFSIISTDTPSNSSGPNLSSSGDIKDTSGNIYGKWYLRSNQSAGKFNGNILFVFNENIKNTTGFEGSVRIPNLGQSQNWTGDDSVVPFNTTIDGITKELSTKGVTWAPITSDGGIFHVGSGGQTRQFATAIYGHDNSQYIYGNPTWNDYPQRENTRFSIFKRGPEGNTFSISLYQSLKFPVNAYPGDKRVSGNELSSVDYQSQLTEVNQIEGETWADFKNRVYSKKYQYGMYRSSQGAGVAVNLGDFTQNGWKNGSVKIPESKLQQLVNMYTPSRFNAAQGKAFIDTYGQNGALKGAYTNFRLNFNGNYRDYAEDLQEIGDYEYIWRDPKQNKEIIMRDMQRLRVAFPIYNIVPLKSSVNVRVLDKDSRQLLTGVNVSLYIMSRAGNATKVGQTIATNSNGVVSWPNLPEGRYFVKLDTRPQGYQDIEHYIAGDNNTSLDEDGIFVLNSTNGAVIDMNLEKIKHQAVSFNVKDTTSNPIVGEVFSITKDGQSLAEYPTNDLGVFSIARLNAGEYSVKPKYEKRAGVVNFLIEEGKETPLNVNAVFNVIPEIDVEAPNNISFNNLTNGSTSSQNLKYIIKYKSDTGYTVSAKANTHNEVNLSLDNNLLTNNEKIIEEFSPSSEIKQLDLSKSLKVETKSNTQKGIKNINITLKFTPKL